MNKKAGHTLPWPWVQVPGGQGDIVVLKPTRFLDTYSKGETKCELRQTGLRYISYWWDLRLQGM